MYSYDTLLAGAQGLLCKVATDLASIGIDYLVIGGWCPYLRNTVPGLPHPGSRDVDVLFRDGATEMELHEVVAELLQKGFILSAKHDFQLLLPLFVGSQQFVYNVDLLHPSESKRDPELFVNHFEFDIPEDNVLRKLRMVRSIVLPNSALLFDGYWSDMPIEGILPDGTAQQVEFPLIDEAGLVLSKCESMKLRKRPRDAYDVYLMLRQQTREDTLNKLADLCASNEDVNSVFEDAVDYLGKRGHVFEENVARYLPSEDDAKGAADFVKAALAECVFAEMNEEEL